MDKLKVFIANNKKVLLVLLGALLAALLIVGIVLFAQSGSQQQNSEEIQQIVEEKTNNLESEVGDLMTLPDETPILSIINDKSLLRGDIYKNAENGDQVLIYENSGIIVVYRESTKEIIASGKVNVGPAEDEDIPAGVEE